MPLDSVRFDAVGVPYGEQGDTFWRGMIEGLFARLNEQGWNRPHQLWHMLTPAALQAAVLAGDATPPPWLVEDSDTTASVAYRLSLVREETRHPRAFLAGMVAPPGTAAIVLVTEDWGSHFTEVGAESRSVPAQERVEIRSAHILEADGSQWHYLHQRGTDLDAMDGLVGGRVGGPLQLNGVVPDLMRRVLRLPVEPPATVGSVLGRASAFLVATVLSSMPSAKRGSAVFDVTLQVIGGILDGLDESWEPDGGPHLHAIFVPGPLSRRLATTSHGNAFSEVVGQARETADAGWLAFLDRRGSIRWLSQDENGMALTGESRDWYGEGHLARFVDESLLDWDGALEALHDACSPEVVTIAMSVLTAAGWAEPAFGDPDETVRC